MRLRIGGRRLGKVPSGLQRTVRCGQIFCIIEANVQKRLVHREGAIGMADGGEGGQQVLFFVCREAI